ncbi:hypothetical protein GQ44DRAFT_761823 [Phaeosphaeriaceae sp. PMI808]|nr:hypothetical protein GQ44DRAFT_761823 [Phaeosphaeriaceae sp. PMI808]
MATPSYQYAISKIEFPIVYRLSLLGLPLEPKVLSFPSAPVVLTDSPDPEDPEAIVVVTGDGPKCLAAETRTWAIAGIFRVPTVVRTPDAPGAGVKEDKEAGIFRTHQLERRFEDQDARICFEQLPPPHRTPAASKGPYDINPPPSLMGGAKANNAQTMRQPLLAPTKEAGVYSISDSPILIHFGLLIHEIRIHRHLGSIYWEDKQSRL